MLTDFLNLCFPKVCYACNALLGDNEQFACTNCRHQFPVTNFHFNNDDSVLKVFYGRLPVQHATALFRFEKKGMVQQLIHNLKYRGFEEVGTFLGAWLGTELKQIPAYQTVDVVIPVPLHKNKLRKRGYNQVTKFGQEIAKSLEANFTDDVLIKVSNTSSQVTKNRITRWLNNSEIFKATNLNKIAGKHVLLVDDIITTGATMEACGTVLLKNNNLKISVAAMAIA
ncbi:ComF family protein [Bizionia sediminis]|uniref:ComF family protein n=1 Tax=Bizionia sediminis TaxID=1737064 RepID=A0ABW5KSF0_9FLAO